MGIGIVETKYGKLLGAELTGKYEGITTFRSVPYAAPPVGELRFAPPQDHEPWNGVLDATHFASRPYQQMGTGLSFEPWASDFYYDNYPPMSEDCLYLHITTGAQDPSEKRPVFMWFHGGGLSTGFYSEIEFDPSELARKGIVVVSVGQRLNIFGYLCLPQLQAEQGGKAGNYGLMDEVKALDWVRENIAAFGGDPDNITIGGQSGGTAKSGALASSPYSVGKVKRCINQSNLNWLVTYQTMEAAGADAKVYLERCGIDPELSVEELRRIPADRFYKAEVAFGAPGNLPGSMVWDGDYVRYQYGVQNVQEFASKVDYLTGGNVGEGGFVNFMSNDKFETAAQFYDFMRERLGPLYEKYDFESLWPVTDENADMRSRVLASRGIALGLFCGVILNRYFGAYRAVHAPETHTYSFSFGHFTPSLPEEAGQFRDMNHLMAWHSSELWYTFASLRENVPPVRPWTEVDFKLADQVSSYWANFIATGNPNGEGLPFWPESRENYGWMYLGDTPEGHDGLDKLDELCLEHLIASGTAPEI